MIDSSARDHPQPYDGSGIASMTKKWNMSYDDMVHGGGDQMIYVG